MTTVKELRKWLKQFPDETIVQVVERESMGGYVGDGVVTKDLNIGPYENWDFADFVGNVWVEEDSSLFGKKILTLGEN